MQPLYMILSRLQFSAIVLAIKARIILHHSHFTLYSNNSNSFGETLQKTGV